MLQLERLQESQVPSNRVSMYPLAHWRHTDLLVGLQLEQLVTLHFKQLPFCRTHPEAQAVHIGAVFKLMFDT